MDYVAAFLASLKSDNKSESTLRGYRTDIEIFLHFLNEKRIPVQNVWVDRAEQYLRSIVSLNSRLRKLSSLKKFFDFLVASGACRNNPFERCVIDYRERPAPIAADDEAFEALERGMRIAGFNDIQKYRALAAIRLARLGLKTGEIVNLNLKDVDPKKPCLSVKAFDGLSRAVSLSEEAFGALTRYLVERFDRPGQDIWAARFNPFLPLIANAKGERLTARTLNRDISEAKRASGHEGATSLKNFRHTHMIESIDKGEQAEHIPLSTYYEPPKEVHFLPENIWSIEEAWRYVTETTGIAKGHFEQLISEGKVPLVVLGRSRWFERHALEKWAQEFIAAKANKPT